MGDLAMSREAGANREFDRLAIEYRQHARHPHAYRADVFVGPAPKPVEHPQNIFELVSR